MLSWKYAKKTFENYISNHSIDFEYSGFKNDVEAWPRILIEEELDKSFVLLLKQWKKNPPPEEVTKEFKELINKNYDPYVHYGQGGAIMDIMLSFAESDEDPYPNTELIGLLMDFGMETNVCLRYIVEKTEPLLKIRDVIISHK